MIHDTILYTLLIATAIIGLYLNWQNRKLIGEIESTYQDAYSEGYKEGEFAGFMKAKKEIYQHVRDSLKVENPPKESTTQAKKVYFYDEEGFATLKIKE